MLDIKQIESFYPEPLRAFKKNLLREYLQFLFTPGDAKKILLFKEYMQSSTVGRVREK